MGATSRFYFKPARGEQVEASIDMTPDNSSAILGTVTAGKGKPVPGALVLLFAKGEASAEMAQIDRGVTDEDGQFLFGPLQSDVLYMIKIYKNSVKIRELEIDTAP